MVDVARGKINGRERMDIRNLFVAVLAITFGEIQSAPVIQKIKNNSQVGFMIVYHSDKSPCSLHQKNKIIDVYSSFSDEFLLTPGIEVAKKLSSGDTVTSKVSLILRPAYFYDRATEQKISLLQDDNSFDDVGVQAAFRAWSKTVKKRKFVDAQDWLTRWVGKDIDVAPDVIEVFGYLIDLSRVHISNDIKDHGQWLSYAKGVFSRLMLEIDIVQHHKKGLYPVLKVIPGEGGVCFDGIVDKI